MKSPYSLPIVGPSLVLIEMGVRAPVPLGPIRIPKATFREFMDVVFCGIRSEPLPSTLVRNLLDRLLRRRHDYTLSFGVTPAVEYTHRKDTFVLSLVRISHKQLSLLAGHRTRPRLVYEGIWKRIYQEVCSYIS